MPIITDKKKFSFEFPYEWEGEDGNKINFPCKYLYGTYGPTVQIFFGEGQGVELPADIFAEIGNFLVHQGILSPIPSSYNQSTQMSAGGKPLAVPLLKGGAGMMSAKSTGKQNPFMPPQTALSQNVNPLAPQSALGNQYPNEEVPSLSNEEIMAAREEARKNANPINKFKKSHKEGEYVAPDEEAARRASKAASDAEQEQ